MAKKPKDDPEPQPGDPPPPEPPPVEPPPPTPPPVIDPALASAVEGLLRESAAAHLRAKQLRSQKDFWHGDEQLRIARDKRVQAHELDPEHTAPEWQVEQARMPHRVNCHDAMMAFYDTHLSDSVQTSVTPGK